MLQDQLGILQAPPDILDHPMEGLATTISHNRSSDSAAPPPARGTGTSIHSRPKSAAAMAISNPDQLPSPPQQALKCPRCDSTNTKFCYYNNYSQTQPRHFCKSCRRYWTQGGALRNVPVGGGCRKNKRVKPRSFLNMGGVPGLLDPNSLLMDDSPSNMLAKLGNISGFGGGAAAAGGGSTNFGDEQLLNIAFSRFQECMRQRQQQCGESGSTEGSGSAMPFFDMGFPSLVQRPCTPGNCSCGMCGSRSSALHPSLNIGCNGFDNHMGFSALPSKSMERDGVFTPFEVNPNLYDQASVHHHNHVTTGTSATATLASIEDQLSTFSNLQPHHLVEQSFDDGDDEKNASLGGASNGERLATSPLQLLGGHGGGAASSHQSRPMAAGDHMLHTLHTHHDRHLCSDDERAREMSKLSMHDEKPLMNVDDHNWQQPTFMSEMLFEAPASHSHWSTSHAPSRWPDMHTLSTTPAAQAAAGGIL